jgi:hypothetical protein
MVTGPAQRPGSTQAGTATASASEAAAAAEPEPVSAWPLPQQGPWIAICSLIYQERSSLSSLFTVLPGTLRLRGSGIEYMGHISSMCIHRERSSIGRARASHARGTGIETRRFHMFCSCAEFCFFFHIKLHRIIPCDFLPGFFLKTVKCLKTRDSALATH